jgi:signal transduction histidine kinase
MDKDTLQFLITLDEAAANENWKKALDNFVLVLRKGFVFDNLALYVAENKEGSLPEVIYARATGRGRSAEADASWGEEIANQVISSGKVTRNIPDQNPTTDRVRRPYMIGLPLSFHNGPAALVMVRFGGPDYQSEQILLAKISAGILARIFERRDLSENISQLETARHRAQLQDDFIATISHDLRTPLGFIKGYTTSLLRSDTVWKPETQREFLTIIDEETDHLMTLIDRMLDSARLQSGTMVMEFQMVRMDSLLRVFTQRICARIPQLDVALDIEPAPPIQADTVRLAEVFENLFDNAIKYAPNSRITISMRHTGNFVIITFTDQGPGVPPDHAPFLFERFYRVPNSVSNRGAGLGLFICKEIIQAHNGRISVRTAPGKGTAFRIELPIKR